ncbi:MAG: membrane protein insertase YidC [Alphaproteobacteria bacterium]
MTDNKNFLLALVLSAAVVFGWQYLVGVPQVQTEQQRQAQLAEEKKKEAEKTAVDASASEETLRLPLPEALKLSPARVNIDSETVDGSLNLTGARFDNLQLRKYRATVEADSPEIVLLSPLGSRHPYYTEFGWIAPEGFAAPVPGAKTPWKLAAGSTLAPGRDVVLTYDNGRGLVFTRRIALDHDYMFTITDRVNNRGSAPALLYPYALVSRRNVPETTTFWVLHEGFIGIFDQILEHPTYEDLAEDNRTESFTSRGGWLGITDKYWMATLVPPQREEFTGTFKAYESHGAKAYQADYLLKPRSIAPGATQQVTHRLFAGAKVVSIIEKYRDDLGIERFDYAIDWGWFFFLTKPIFLILDLLYRYIGNFGLAIIAFTIALKLLFFPLQSASYRAMARMKKLQPEMERIRELHKEDKVQQQQALLELYKREKVNPAAGCLPIVIQIPVFFSLYKVLIVTIEMRHAPFFGWVQDLSAPDPTSIFNLFGLLPFQVPDFLLIGVWPILMGLSMWLQMKLNPPPSDPIQAKIFGFMPWILLVLMATFPAGLVIYWTANNVLSIAQQMLIMRQAGVRIDAFDRLKATFAGLRKRVSGRITG